MFVKLLSDMISSQLNTKKDKAFITLSLQISQILQPLIPHQFKLSIASDNGHYKANH
jgi:hypothetical protein